MQEKNFSVNFAGSTYNAWYVRTPKTANQLLRELQTKASGTLFGIDTETRPTEKYKAYPFAGLSPHLSEVRLLQVFDGTNSVVFDVLHLGGECDFLPLLTTGRFVGHNSIFDLQYFLLKLGVKEMNLGCTRILYKLVSQAFYPVDTGLDAKLSSIVERVLKVDVKKILQVSDWSEPELTFEQIEYAALDAILVMKVAEKLAVGLEKYGLTRVYNLCKNAQAALAKMQINGLKLDTEAHKNLIVKWREDAHVAKKEVLRVTGLDDVTSHKISGWLETNLSKELLHLWPKTPGGKLSTDAHAFSEFGHLDVVEPMLKFQKATTLCSTFGQNLLNKINPHSGRVHCGYNIAGARTGRLSSSNPNFQNAPRLPEFRQLFLAREGQSLISADYSQIELRVAAEVSGDRNMLQVYRSGEDIYKVTAAKLNRKRLEDVTKGERQVAKALALGLLFGLGTAKFAHYARKGYGVIISAAEAERSVEGFRQLYPQYRAWQLNQAETAKITLTVNTPCGKKRRLHEDDAYGAAMNQPIQGGAAEVLLHSLVRLEKLGRKRGFFLLNTVHDEVVLEVKDGSEEEISKEVNAEMTNAYLDVFPNGVTRDLVGIGHGKNWAEAK